MRGMDGELCGALLLVEVGERDEGATVVDEQVGGVVQVQQHVLGDGVGAVGLGGRSGKRPHGGDLVVLQAATPGHTHTLDTTQSARSLSSSSPPAGTVSAP